MSILRRKITEGEEREFDLRSREFYRPPLKQIGNSIYEIRNHYMSGDAVNVIPSMCTTHIAGIRDTLLSHLEDDSFLYKKNIVTGASLEVDCDRKRSVSSFVVLMDSLALAMDFAVPPRPSDVQCDILLAVCGQPVILLTLVDGDKDSKAVTLYHSSVAKGITTTLRKFMDETINIVSGVLHRQDMETMDTFRTAISTTAEESSFFVTLNSFKTSPSKYEKIVTAFWAGVAETRSVMSRDGRVDTDYLRFLTKDQCVILMENINNREVEVQFKAGTGATTLMVEVARRLDRLDKTLLVCRSREEKEKLTSLHVNVITPGDLRLTDLSKYTNLVDETGTLNDRSVSGKFWKFTASYTEAELQHIIEVFEKENANREKLIHLFSSDDRQDKFKHISREFETLKLFDMSFQGFLSAYHLPYSLTLEHLSVKQKPSGNTGERDRDQRLEVEEYVHHVLDQLKLGIRGRRDLLPLLIDMTRQVRRMIPKMQASVHFQELGEKREKRDRFRNISKVKKRVKAVIPYLQTKFRNLNLGRKPAETHTVADDVSEVTNSEKISELKKRPQTLEMDVIGEDEIPVQTEKHMKPTSLLGRKPAETHTVADDVSEVTNSEISKLKERLQTLEMEADSQQRELAQLREATDFGVEWDCNMEYLEEEMSALKIQEIINDVIGEDEVPMQIEKHMKPTFLLDDDRSMSAREVRCQVYELRKLQYGTMKQREVMDILKNVIKDDQSRLTHLRTQSERLKRGDDSLVYMAGEIDTDHGGPVSCPPMTFNRERVGDENLAVSGDGLELVNWRDRTLDHRTDRFKYYNGTSSRLPIPLPPSPSTLTAATYWETHTRLQVKDNVSYVYLLEMAVCGEGEIDTSLLVSFQDRSSWGLHVGYCDEHPGVCTKVWENGRQVGECQTDTMSPTPGTDVTLKYGIALDVGRERLAFIDLNRGRVLHKFDVKFLESLSPMFSVWPFPDYFHATMRLISGREVAMTGEKQQLIAQALFCK